MTNTSAQDPQHLFIIGPGYSAGYVAALALSAGWLVSATYRSSEKQQQLKDAGLVPVPFGSMPTGTPVTHCLVSVPPSVDGDPAYDTYQPLLQQCSDLSWIGYLSSTNVYGNHDGGWVDEETLPTPSLDRGIRRVHAEKDWSEFASSVGSVCHIFRLAGIYGPGRNAITTIQKGRARRVIKEGQLFSRIHVEDIAQTVLAAMTSGAPSTVFNLADDAPAPPQDVILYAANLMGVAPPEEVAFEDADLSPMAKSFYAESKRVRNTKIKEVLNIRLRYPSYEQGLQALWNAVKD
ncbi:NAD(P)-dependent oxidoreductase [Kordiimonas sediminis]|uniref:NAD(P)-dependent oxidoreductase n=1 Tax=Kordiimonas sediminis TaxID=1735581 RepID=A0A919ALV4_9PROT|nr:SDR family oxidoreductase [Kordiimonas sediminis]GHF15802.1 NAD(P)-dependent oxidoreductase [Kordiimonas sediminis]